MAAKESRPQAARHPGETELMKNLPRLLLNFALFQTGWALCVFAGNLAALPYTVAALGIHARWILRTRREWQLIAGLAAAGSGWDYLLATLGLIHFAGTAIALGPLALTLAIPPWLACLWLLFATTLSHTFAWLHRRLPLAAILAALSAPLTYLGGAALNGSEIPNPWLAAIASGWAILFPAGLFAARRIANQATPHA